MSETVSDKIKTARAAELPNIKISDLVPASEITENQLMPADTLDSVSGMTQTLAISIKQIADYILDKAAPISTIYAIIGETPSGFLECNGQTFDSNLYPKLAELFPALKMPDMRGRHMEGMTDGAIVGTPLVQRVGKHAHTATAVAAATTVTVNSATVNSGAGNAFDVDNSKFHATLSDGAGQLAIRISRYKVATPDPLAYGDYFIMSGLAHTHSMNHGHTAAEHSHTMTVNVSESGETKARPDSILVRYCMRAA